jgi:branched-chain amino acid transport system ATP-binding protein
MLEARALHVGYGDAPALRDVSLAVGAGEIVAVVGPNGAGKTTLINALARLLPIGAGTLGLEGKDVTRGTPQELCRLGVALIPEGRGLFAGMSVEENLELGCYRRDARGWRADGLARVYAMFPILGERRRQVAGTLSGGQQQMVALGRALMARPRLLLVDEPSLGLAPLVVAQVFDALAAIHRDGVSILLVEQNAALALAVAEHAAILEAGRVVLRGTAEELAAHEDVREAYLGLGAAGAIPLKGWRLYRRRRRW